MLILSKTNFTKLLLYTLKFEKTWYTFLKLKKLIFFLWELQVTKDKMKTIFRII